MTVNATLPGISSTATDLTVVVSLDAVPNNTVYNTITGRLIGSADYSAQVKIYANGATQLYLDAHRRDAGGRYPARSHHHGW